MATYDPSLPVSYIDPSLGQINEGISMTWNWRNLPTGATDNPSVHHHLTTASNAILSAAGHHGKGDINKALISVDSALLHWRDAAKHLRMMNEDKLIVMNPGMRYLMGNDAPREMLDRQSEWRDDNYVLDSLSNGTDSK
jgi:hypothetical protein